MATYHKLFQRLLEELVVDPQAPGMFHRRQRVLHHWGIAYAD
jgi:hypothetical protein